MARESTNTEKNQHTGILIGLLNLCLSPIYYLDTRLGVSVSLAATAAVLYKFNEIGEAKRPGANLINSANNFFSPHTGDPNTDLENTARNIVNGGDAVFKQIFSRP